MNSLQSGGKTDAGKSLLVVDEAGDASKSTTLDPLGLPIGPITRERVKKVKEALNNDS